MSSSTSPPGSILASSTWEVLDHLANTSVRQAFGRFRRYVDAVRADKESPRIYSELETVVDRLTELHERRDGKTRRTRT